VTAKAAVTQVSVNGIGTAMDSLRSETGLTERRKELFRWPNKVEQTTRRVVVVQGTQKSIKLDRQAMHARHKARLKARLSVLAEGSGGVSKRSGSTDTDTGMCTGRRTTNGTHCTPSDQQASEGMSADRSVARETHQQAKADWVEKEEEQRGNKARRDHCARVGRPWISDAPM